MKSFKTPNLQVI